jgi:polyisoprenoid-binding protein YceI
MLKFFRVFTISLLVTLSITHSISAKPAVFNFDYPASDISFTYTFSGDTVQGAFPKFSGDLLVDFKDIRKSKVTVTIDASAGQGGFIFATSALRGSKILDTDTFPTIVFQSTSAQISGGNATVDGNITVHGVTKPIRLAVQFFQLNGQDPAARDSLQMVITGRVNRHDFGASGYPDLVGDFLDIKINAKIDREK